MPKKRRLDVGVRMTNQELTIVRYITRQLAGAYCNAAGKPEYARNLDQVMEDIFGIKKFTKTLERGVHDEATMIALMRQMDIDTIWNMTRNSNHYRMLCALVAMDSEIVRISKKMDKIVAMEPTERPSGKYQKLRKQLKELRKKYKNTVKTFRDIFDIKKAGSGSVAGLLDVADDWMDRFSSNRRGDSIFDIFDYDDGAYSAAYGTESMDDYLRRASTKGPKGGRAPRRNTGSGAFGLTQSRRPPDEEGDSIYDEYFGTEEEDDSDTVVSDNPRLDAVEGAIKAIAEHVGKLTTAVTSGKPMYQPSPEPRYAPRPRSVSRPRGLMEMEDDDAHEEGPQDPISWAINRNTAAVDKLVGALTGVLGGQTDDEPGGYWESPPIELRRSSAPPMDSDSVSVEEALRMAEPDDGPAPGTPIEVDSEDDSGPAPAAPDGGEPTT